MPPAVSEYIIKAALPLLVSALFLTIAAAADAIVPAGDWRDTDGTLIHATEGGFIKVNDTIFMWGMDRSANNHAFEAINLYASTDFKQWKFINKILKKTSHPDIDNGAVIERAKILHNEKSGQFVLWMHYEGHKAYSIAEVAYATSSTIGGNYTFKEHFRPNKLDSRDLNVYKDDDGKAYLICTTEGNQSVSLFELNDAYTGIKSEIYRGHASDDMECEGHGIIKTGGYYFWLMSWCSGWDFNENHYYYSKTLKGPWTKGGNIAVANTHTYESQVGFSYTHKGSSATSFVYLGDRWSVRNFSMSRLVVLPIEVSGTSLKVKWHDQWDLDTKTGKWYAGAHNFIDGEYTITARHSGKVLGTSSSSSSIQQQDPSGAKTQLWRIENRGASHFRITSAGSGKSLDVSDESRTAGAKVLQYGWKDTYNQKWHIIDCGGGYHRFIAVNTLGKTLEIEGASKALNANAVIGNFAYKDHQMFRITAAKKEIVSGKQYRIVSRASAQSISAETAGKDMIILNKPSNQALQVWTVTDLFTGYYTFVNAGHKTALDNSNSFISGTTVIHSPTSDRFTQQWQAVSTGSGYYKIFNRKSGKVLEDRGGNGTDAVQADDNGTANQQWKFEQVDVVTSTSGVYPLQQHPPTINLKHCNSTLYTIRGEKILQDHEGTKALTGNKLISGVYLVKSQTGGRALITVR